VGVGGAAAAGFVFGLSVQGSVEVVADPQGNVGLAFTGGGNPGWPFVIGVGAIAGGQYSVSNSASIYGLRGQAFSAGASAGAGPAVGLDVSGSFPSGHPATATLTVGVGGGTKGTGFAITGTAVPDSLSTNCNQ
jgi:membrane-associated phospholipid phosphatase